MAVSQLVVAVVLLAGTAAGRDARPRREPFGAESLIDMVADLMPGLTDLSGTLDLAKDIAMSRWKSKEVIKSDLETAALMSEVLRQDLPRQMAAMAGRTVAGNKARYFPSSGGGGTCSRPKSPRMAYCKDEEEDEYVKDEEEDDTVAEAYQRALDRMKYVPGEDDNYAKVMIMINPEIMQHLKSVEKKISVLSIDDDDS